MSYLVGITAPQGVLRLRVPANPCRLLESGDVGMLGGTLACSVPEEVEMTDEAKQAWGEVGERFASWGRRVSDRYKESEHSEAETEETTKELQRAAREVIDGLSRGVTAVGGTLRDPQATEDLKAAVSALGDAITATVTEATDAIRSGKAEESEVQAPTDAPEPPDAPPPVEGNGEPKDSRPA
jgi:signal transduction histidine kinase